MSVAPKLCFVIMPFSKERKEVFTYGIAPACKRAGFEAVRVDELKGSFNIHRKIIEHLFKSDVVIAEITDKNPNVFYEMGVAHCLGNKTIMIAQNARDLPFDISNYRCLIYEQTVDGLLHLQEQIVESLEELDTWSQSSNNPVQDFKPEEAFIPKSKAELLRRQLEQQVRENEKLMRNSIAPIEWQKLQAEHQRAQAELKAKEQAAAQHAAKMQALQKEVERLRALVSAPKPAQAEEPPSEIDSRLLKVINALEEVKRTSARQDQKTAELIEQTLARYKELLPPQSKALTETAFDITNPELKRLKESLQTKAGAPSARARSAKEREELYDNLVTNEILAVIHILDTPNNQELSPALKALVEACGLKVLSASKNRKFDPDFHHSVGLVDGPKDLIVEVSKRGFAYKGRLLNPAEVTIGRG